MTPWHPLNCKVSSITTSHFSQLLNFIQAACFLLKLRVSVVAALLFLLTLRVPMDQQERDQSCETLCNEFKASSGEKIYGDPYTIDLRQVWLSTAKTVKKQHLHL